MVERVGFEGGTVTIEYELGADMVIFSHDFATMRDDRGLLSAIAGSLPRGFGYILFDYYDTDDKAQTIQIKTFAEQQKRLAKVIDWAVTQKEVKRIHIIGHSFGCIIVARLKPANVEKIILMAPPTVLSTHLKRFTESREATLKTGVWTIHRDDDTTVRVPDSFFSEMKLTDGEVELAQLAERHEYTLVLPSSDEVLPDADYTELIVNPAIHCEVVDDTDHFFEGVGRQQLLNHIQAILVPPDTPANP